MTDYVPSGCFVHVHTHAGENTGHMIRSDLDLERPTCSGEMPQSSTVHNLLPLPGDFLDG